MRQATTNLVRFDRPLVGARVVGENLPAVSVVELEAERATAYQKGNDAAREFADAQMVELRTDVQQLSDGLFTRLNEMEPALVGQVRAALPQLVVEATRRLLNGFVHYG